jgi:hypothetical protein
LATLKSRSSRERAKPTHSQKLASYPQSTSATSDGSTRQTTPGARDEYFENWLLNSIFAGAIGGGATVKPTPAEDIVEFLNFSRDPGDRASELRKFSLREWERVLSWLDDAGLAFYFLQKLKNTNETDRVPAWVTSRLERNFAANQQRVGDMSHRLGFLNKKFSDAGVRYAVLKGLSLVPQFCPNATLRFQGDFDYLVDEQSSLTAQQVLVEAGYNPKVSLSPQEFIFVMPGTEEPSRGAEQYQARAPHAVELHLDIWDSEINRLPLLRSLFFVERARTHHWNGFSFPALPDEDAFLLQVVHTCNHFFAYWIRMSSLYEIGYFLNCRASDGSLWDRIEQRVGDNVVLRELVVVVTELVAKLFGAPLPPLVRVWGLRIRPASRVWIERYARDWAFCELPIYQFRLFPRAKLVLFLHQQYKDPYADRALVRNRVFTFSRFSRIASSVKEQPSLMLEPAWWKRQLLIRRSLFHALAGLRYLCEIPRWRWLNRARMRSAYVDAGIAGKE